MERFTDWVPNLDPVTHRAPRPEDGGLMPCCGLTPFEVPGDRMTNDPDLVTCPGGVLSYA